MIYKITYNPEINPILIKYEILETSPFNLEDDGIASCGNDPAFLYLDTERYDRNIYVEILLEQIRTIENRSKRLKKILNNDL
jgi:hypothetical protein